MESVGTAGPVHQSIPPGTGGIEAPAWGDRGVLWPKRRDTKAGDWVPVSLCCSEIVRDWARLWGGAGSSPPYS